LNKSTTGQIEGASNLQKCISWPGINIRTLCNIAVADQRKVTRNKAIVQNCSADSSILERDIISSKTGSIY